MRPLFDEATIDQMVLAAGSPALRTAPLHWKAYYAVDDQDDEEGNLWRGAAALGNAKDRDAMLRCLILLRNACAQRFQLKPPLNDKNCHELVSGDYRDRPYLIYELIVGRVRMPWFYGEDRNTLVVTHCFKKTTQKASSTEQGKASALIKQYRDAHHAAPQNIKFIGE